MGETVTTNANMVYYLAMWREMLSALLGWPDERVMQWVSETGLMECMADPADILYHETPQYWIKHLLVPESLKQRLSPVEVIAVEQRILAAFSDSHRYEFPVRTHWQDARARIERILHEYGVSLNKGS